MNKTKNIFRVFTNKTWIRLTIAFGLFLFPTFLFIQLADEVRDSETLPYDEAILRSINSVSSPFLDGFSVGLTQLGGVLGVFVITTGITVLLWRRSKRLSAMQLAVSVAGAGLLNLILKAVFQRDRPDLWERIVTENSFSFPSGHAMASSALALSLIVVFWPTKWRWIVVTAALLYMLSIALTRLYLGVHYPTDILAGWIVSGAWVVLVTTIVRYRAYLSQVFKRITTGKA